MGVLTHLYTHRKVMSSDISDVRLFSFLFLLVSLLYIFHATILLVCTAGLLSVSTVSVLSGGTGSREAAYRTGDAGMCSSVFVCKVKD